MFPELDLPTVSVLIPTYNSAVFLDEAIQSVLAQTFIDFELVIVDNCSTDNTQQLVAKYLSDKRVKYYVNDTNVGMIGNWTKALLYAKGKYIKFLMSDDIFHIEMLEHFVNILDNYPSVTLVSSYKEMFGSVEWKFQSPFSGLQNGLKAAEHSILSHNWLGEPTTVMFRKESLWIGGFNKEFILYPDWDFWLRLLKIGDLYVIPEYLSYFRIHEEQSSSQSKKNYVSVFETYTYLNFLYDFGFADFVYDEPFKSVKKAAAQNCINLLSVLRKEKKELLIAKALEIGAREDISSPNLARKIISRLRAR